MSHAAWSADHEFRVLHHESVQLESRAEVGAAEHLTFDAYGRRFELSVTPNERIRRGIASVNTRTMPLQGSVDGVPGSWVRITRSASGWRGLIFDGRGLYAIETAQDLAGFTVEPLDASGAAPIVYRLADAELPLDVMSCEIVQPDTPPTAASAFESITHELHAQAAQLAAMKQVRVGVVGDYEFVTQFAPGTTPEDAIVARMNIVDGIFTTQAGVKISLAPPTLFRMPSDPFTKTKASDLLTELRTYRNGSAAQKALGITHLMTGRDLDGDTVGIAYIGSVCQGANAASLSEGRRSTTQSALIAAHEIGHNFNAPHDGEAGACASTPTTFLMAPRLNGSDQFSACSIEQMQPVINNATCLTAYTPPDASLEIANPALQATVGTAFVASFVVRATGDDASADVNVMAAIPASLTIQSVTANGGTCTSGAGTASCSLGSLAAGDTRQIDLNLTPTEAGSLTLNVSIDSSNDPNSSNDTGTITVTASGTSTPAPNPPPTGGTSTAAGGGGGGGRVDLTLLGLLGTALLAARGRELLKPRRTPAVI
jgi:hypothetical protein